MTKIIKSKYKASRRLGVSIWGDGKDSFNVRNYKPGQHGQGTLNKISDYGLHLQAKQRLKCHYGRINEKQFRNIFKLAQKSHGDTGEAFIGLLESRLDAVVYRLGLAASIFAARQLVSHAHITINGKKATIPSMRVKGGDVIAVRDKSKQIASILVSVAKKANTIPTYLSFDEHSLTGKFIRTPNIADVPYPFEPNAQSVVEWYSR